MKPRIRPLYCAAIIERADNSILIAQDQPAEQPEQWMFPRGIAQPDESAEAAMRRIAREQLGVFVELVIGQPPLPVNVDGVPSEIRYFFCGLAGGQPQPGPYNRIQWVNKAQLAEFGLDETSHAVADWLLSSS